MNETDLNNQKEQSQKETEAAKIRKTQSLWNQCLSLFL